MQNSETGEVSYIQTDADKVQQLSYDAETGEPIIGKIRVRYIKQKNFQIPKKLLRGSPCEEFEKEMLGRSEEIYQEPCASISKEPPASTVQTVKPKLKCKTKTYNRDDFINMEGVSNFVFIEMHLKAYYVLNQF
uniref:Uncharacterized protein n=1 Tax=Musca domestica TaxID=7370 RepID=A0A1I8NCX1_MUSDO